MIGRAVVALAVLAIMGGRLAAQDATGRVEGSILGGDGLPVAAARVSASSPSLQGRRSVETDLRGHFLLFDLGVGTYQVQVASIGYRRVVVDDVDVRLGRTSSLGEIRLESQALDLGEIMVMARPALLDLASAAAVTNIASEQFRALPTDRNFRSIISLAPETVHTGLPGDEVNIAGSTGPENAYYLDGVNITDLQNAGTSADLPYNFVQEIEVKEGGFEAEYGRATGGIVNIITRSGGNRFGGEVFGFYTNDRLTAEPRFTDPSARETRYSGYDVGGSLGGPILRDRLWFFGAYAPRNFRQGTEVAGFTLPDDHLTQHLFASKLTWQAGPRTDVMLALHGDPLVNHVSNLGLANGRMLVNPDPILNLVHEGGLVLSGLVRRRFGGTARAEVSAARFSRRNDSDPATERGRLAPRLLDFDGSALSGGVGEIEHVHTVRTAVRASFSVATGPHAVKLGLDYEDNRLDDDHGISSIALEHGKYTWFRAHLRSSVGNRAPSAYVQDAWRFDSRVTLKAGLRWDGQYFIGPEGTVVQSFTDQWQPRLGLIYALGRPGSQKLYGSFARLYEQIPLALVSTYYDPQPVLASSYVHDPRVDSSGAVTETRYPLGSERAQPVQRLKGQAVDELTLGYERALGSKIRVGVRGVYRRLRWAVEDAADSSGNFHVGNPGRETLAFLPRATRVYKAIVVTLEQPAGGRFDFLASYVLSRSRGNYAGLYDYVANGAGPNISLAYDSPYALDHNTGLLPNDRRHVLKFSGSYRLAFGITVGTALAWMSGAPEEDLLALPDGGLSFFRPRGTAGTTGGVLDAAARLTWRPPRRGMGAPRPTIFLDLFQIGNRRTVLARESLHYYGGRDANGNPVSLNPSYGAPLEFQPPMSARLGLSVDFGAEP